MRNRIKQGMGSVLMIALLIGVLAAQPETVQAKNKAFENKCCSSQEKSYMNDGSFTIEPWFTYGSRNDYLSSSDCTVKQGVLIRATLALTPNASVKSVSIKSSNNKVLKVDKKKGTFKAVKTGTATISYKVVWSTSDKIYKSRNTKNMKNIKKGNTYTSTAKVKVKVVCKSHKYSEWVTTKEASCEKEGRKERTCSKCGEKQTRTIEETGHKYDSTTHKCIGCGKDDPDYEGEEE